ncbi:MAG TPA: DUF2892 domain-containing protein [Bacillota bacterium]|nr:DUF2892 domain-containing protein [Bacillota bacterium]
MKKNVGTLDALIRITFGLLGLTWGISRIVRSREHKFPLFITFMSALKVAEGVVRFCPGLALFGVNTIDEEDRSRKSPFPTQYYARRKVSPVTTTDEEKRGHQID